mgnify:CR=1 FL=1|tara:strand:+ start:549 stop:743 length:195 start_codon:yes stop_codon:yes gene_type:complete
MVLYDKLGDNGDAFYNCLMAAHDGLSEAQSHALNARLILILANEIADLSTLQELVHEATKAARN